MTNNKKIKHIKIVKNPTAEYFLRRYEKEQLKLIADYVNAYGLGNVTM